MLTHLYIRNYALLTELELTLEPGFTVLTGETGAGKSILLGALGLIMGQRADQRVITQGEPKCVVEGSFSADGVEYLIRREVMQNGKSRAFVNDSPVTLAELKELSSRLIDIHSQHENLLLRNDNYQLFVLDTLAQNQSIRESYARAYATYKETEQRLSQLRRQAATAAEDGDYVRFRFQQLDEAHLQEGELPELEQELERLNHVEDIKTALSQVSQGLNDEDESLVQRLKQLCQAMRGIRNYITEASELAERLQQASIELDDLAATADQLNEAQDFDPQRLQWVTDRYDLLNHLLQKFHAADEGALIAKRDELDQQLQHLDNFDEEVAALEQQLLADHEVLRKAGLLLTQSRQAVTKSLESQLQTMLADLGIQHPLFRIEISALTDASESGFDSVQFFFAANKSQQAQPLSEVASGGEISRVMLCLKALMAQSQQLPTLLLDEIDTGVSGRAAEQMARIMQEMGCHMQLLTITHLPQIAARGQQHLLVYKIDTSERTETHIRRLSPHERIQEIAKMMSGSSVTPEAIKAAERLCNL